MFKKCLILLLACPAIPFSQSFCGNTMTVVDSLNYSLMSPYIPESEEATFTTIVPVVFFIYDDMQDIGNGQVDRLVSSDQVIDQLIHLNQAFQGMNINGGQIQFCLATATNNGTLHIPNGGTINNVEHIVYNTDPASVFWIDDSRLIQMDPADYAYVGTSTTYNQDEILRIIVSNHDQGQSQSSNVGNQYMSTQTNNGNQHMIFITKEHFLDNNIIMDMNHGDVLAHEVGHSFGLWHLQEGNCSSYTPCTTTGDLVCDTEPLAMSFNQNPDCLLDPVSECSGFKYNNDIRENHMDSDQSDWCRASFTNGQFDRMSSIFHKYFRGLSESSNIARSSPVCGLNTNNAYKNGNIKSLESIKEPFTISAFPNPSNTNFELKIYGATSGEVEIRLIDVRGVIQKRIFTNTSESLFQKSIDISDLAKGTYSIEAINNDYSAHQRMIIQ
jgi:hypothetical protein